MAGTIINSVGGAAVLISAAFLLGTLAVHWTADHLVLWQRPLTAEHLAAAHAYYARTFPRDTLPGGGVGDVHAWAQRGIAAAGLVGAAGAGAKVFAGGEGNWLFDGATLFLLSAVGLTTLFTVIPLLRAIPPFPLEATLSLEFSLNQQLQDLASANVTIAAALVGVLLLQGGQYYALRSQTKEDEAILEKQIAEARETLATARAAPAQQASSPSAQPPAKGKAKKRGPKKT